MRIEIRPAVLLMILGLALAGCSVTDKLSDQFKTDTPGSDSFASAEPSPLANDPTDDVSLGKAQYRANNFGLAEKYFRRAVEVHPRDAEAWLGLAASYDQLRRFDLADRAYAQAISIAGPVPEILNNQGYSYLLRGDKKRASERLAAAQRSDPSNRYVQSNLQLLQESAR